MKLIVAIVEKSNLRNLVTKLTEANILFKNISSQKPEESNNSTLLIEGKSEEDIITLLQKSLTFDNECYFISEPPFELSNGDSDTLVLNLEKFYHLH